MSSRSVGATRVRRGGVPPPAGWRSADRPARDLYLARLIGGMERTRARILLGLTTQSPAAARPGWRGRLVDAAGWRAVAYGLLLGPVGALTGTLTVIGWSTALAAIAFPAYAWILRAPAPRGHARGHPADRRPGHAPGPRPSHLTHGDLAPARTAAAVACPDPGDPAEEDR